MPMFHDCYRKRRVLITGHTGFKGSHLAYYLGKLGAELLGVALEPEEKPNHWELLKPEIDSRFFDVRDADRLEKVFRSFRPEIVFHLAAQALVRPSYADPAETFAVNVGGTVNVLEACRKCPGVRAAVIVTSDKCYENPGTRRRFREGDPVGGYDPYSASKGCAEIVAASYRRSFFPPEEYARHGLLLASARAGNAIGGGDYARDRLIPDLVRAAASHTCAKLRNPDAVRPWQHVWEPLTGYLCLGEKLLSGDARFAGAWNFGPASTRSLTVREAAEIMAKRWPEIKFSAEPDPCAPREARTLRLDCSRAARELNWRSVWSARKALEITADWYREFIRRGVVLTDEQLRLYFDAAKKAGAPWTE